jgi:hypothetical protein
VEGASVEVLAIALFLGLIPAAIAHEKGRSFIGFWAYGTLLFIVALPHALLMPPTPQAEEKRNIAQGRRKCPHCAEYIKAEATVCRFCGREVGVV